MTEPQPPLEPPDPTPDAPDDATEPVRLDPDAVAELLPAEDAVVATPAAAEPDAAPAETLVAVPPATPALPPASPPPASPPPVAREAAVAVTSTVVSPTVAVVPRRTWPSTVSRIVAFLFGILQALLILRIGLLFLNANQDNDIVAWVLSVTDPFVEPFRGMFQLDEVTGAAGSVFDIAAVVALIAWSLIETLILSILRLFGRRA